MPVYTKSNSNFDPYIIRIDYDTTDKVIEVVQEFINRKIIKPARFMWAQLDYTVNHEIDPDPGHDEHYPLHFYDNDSHYHLYVTGVSAGFNSSGAEGTLKLLELLGFAYSAEEERMIRQPTYNDEGQLIEHISKLFYKRK